MVFYSLLLGHLLGDFTFQTDKIATNKNNSIIWILWHSVIVTVCMLVFAYPFGFNLMGLVLINGLLHFIIDFGKSKILKKGPFVSFLLFLLDQALHVSIIYLISIIYSYKAKEHLSMNTELISFFIALAFTISFSTIFVQYLLKIFFPKIGKKFFLENERAIGNMIRGLTFFILYLGFCYSSFFLFLLVPLLGALVFLFNRKWKNWMSKGYFSIKITLDFTMSLIGISILLIFF